MKSLLLMLFAFGNVLGPWLCCCVVAAMKPAVRVEVVEECPHCSRCPKQRPLPVKEEPKPKCPCASPTFTDLAKPDVSVSLDDADLPVVAMIDGVDSTLTANTTANRVVGACWLSADLRIHGHHVMRC